MFSNTEYWQKKLTKIEPKLVKILRIKDHEFNVERKALESFHRRIKEMENKEEVNEAGEGDSKNRKQDDKKKRKRDCLLFDDDISADLRLIFGTDDDLECKKKMKERKDDKRRSVIKNESEKIRVKGENENFDGSIKDKRKGVGNSDKSTGKEDNAADASNFTNDKAEPAGKGGYGRGKGKGKEKNSQSPTSEEKTAKNDKSSDSNDSTISKKNKKKAKAQTNLQKSVAEKENPGKQEVLKSTTGEKKEKNETPQRAEKKLDNAITEEDDENSAKQSKDSNEKETSSDITQETTRNDQGTLSKGIKNNAKKKKITKSSSDEIKKVSKSVNSVSVNQGVLKINQVEYRKGDMIAALLYDCKFLGEIANMNFSEIIIKTRAGDKMKIQTSSLRAGTATIEKTSSS